MDTQTLISVLLGVPAVALAVYIRVNRSRLKTSFGLSLKDGALGEFGRGILFSVPFVALLLGIFAVTGLSDFGAAPTEWGIIAGIWFAFFILLIIEEVVFRGLLMTGIGVVAGQRIALGLTAVLVASAYLFADHTGVLAMVGAVVTNLLHGALRWRTGRIWWGFGQRWAWNCGMLTFGFSDSAYSLEHPVFLQHLDGPTWLTGGQFGIEAGLIGIALLALMLLVGTRVATGRKGPWTIEKTAMRSSAG